MRFPTKGYEDGIFDPRLHTKEFSPQDENSGHFAGAANSVVRYLTFGSGTGDRNIECWRTPSSGEYIIKGAVIALIGDWTQSGTAVPIIVSVEIERKPASGYWLALAQALLLEDKFIATVYESDTNQTVFGMRDFQWLEGANYVESPHRAYDGRVNVVADNTTDIFTTSVAEQEQWNHGIAPDEPLRVQAGTTGVLPTGIANQVYYKRGTGTVDLQISATPGGAAVNFTTDGTPPMHVVPVEKSVTVSRRGIYVGASADRFRASKVRLRARTLTGANTWAGSAQVSLQLLMIK